MALTRKRILVTGGAGFLGSHLCERLIRDGDDVLCVDNYFTGRKDNIAHLMGDPHFEAMRHDITFPLYIEVDEIYNLACPASPVHYQYDPVQTTKTSVIGAINMLGLAKRIGAKILQASTSEVYGDPTVHPQTEDYRGNVNPLGPRACYDEGKRCAETLFFDYHRQHRTRIKVARIFNTYGPRMHPNDGRVVSNFIVQALRGEDITLYGDGSQTRAFCYVDDLIDGFVRLMATGDDVTGPINLGNPHEIPVRELADRVIRLTSSRSRIVFSRSAEGRSAAALPRHHACAPRTGLGAARATGRRSGAHDRLFRPHADRAQASSTWRRADRKRSQKRLGRIGPRIDRRRLAADQIRDQPPGCRSCRQADMAMSKGVHHVLATRGRADARQPIRGRWPVAHPDLHLVRREIMRQVGKHAPRKVAQHRGTLPVRRSIEPGQLHLPGETQTLRRHHARHLPVARHHRIARCDAWLRDERVVATLGLQRHAIAGGGGQYLRPGPGGDHRLVRWDLARVGAHRTQPLRLDAKAERPATTQFGAERLRMAHQCRDIGAGIAALPVLLDQHTERVRGDPAPARAGAAHRPTIRASALRCRA